MPTLKLVSKERVGSRTVRQYGPARTPPARVLDCPQVDAPTQEQLRRHKQSLNPFALRRQVDQQLKEIDQQRLLCRA